MKAPPFAYVRPRSLDEAIALLQRHGESAKLLAGGQSLMPALNMRLASPQVLIDISRLQALAAIREADGHLHIGALVTHAAIAASEEIRRHLPLLADAAPHIAHPAIRNSGTFGGSLATADPAAEWPACCVTLDARIVLVCHTGTRRVAAREFFLGPYTTAMQPDEMLTEVVFAVPGSTSRHAFVELARRRGDYAIVGIAAQGRLSGQAISELHLTYLGAGDRPVHAPETARVFVSQGYSETTLELARQQLARELEPVADLYHTAATKLHLARVLTGRAMQQLLS